MNALGWIKGKVYGFALKKVLGRFFEEVGLEQVEGSLRSGVLELRALRLKTSVLNRMLASAPLRAVSGTVACVRVTVSLHNFLSESLCIEFDGIELALEAAPAQASAAPAAPRARGHADARASTRDVAALASSMHDDSPYEADGDAIDESVQMLAQAIKQFSSNAKLALTNVCIRFAAAAADAASGAAALALRVDSIELGEDTAQPRVGDAPRHRYHKQVRFGGVRVELARADGSVATLVQLGAESASRALVGFQRSDDGHAQSVAEVELDVYLPLLRVDISVAELAQLTELARGLSAPPVRGARADAEGDGSGDGDGDGDGERALDASALRWPAAAGRGSDDGAELADSAFASFIEGDGSGGSDAFLGGRRSLLRGESLGESLASSAFTDARSLVSSDDDDDVGDGFRTCTDGASGSFWERGSSASPPALGEFSFIYRYILRESCSQFDSLPLTSLMNC
jgi:hypothetical protein